MTWGEFKRWVAEQDVPDDTEIRYVDFGWDGPVRVELEEGKVVIE